MTEDARHRCNIRAARDHQTGGGVAEGMDIQLLQQRFYFGGVHMAVACAGLDFFYKYLPVVIIRNLLHISAARPA